MFKRSLVLLVVLAVFAGTVQAAMPGSLISWWREGSGALYKDDGGSYGERAKRAGGAEVGPGDTIIAGDMWGVHQATSLPSPVPYESAWAWLDVYTTPYTGPAHAAADLPASPWASQFHVGTGNRADIWLNGANGTKDAHDFAALEVDYTFFMRMRNTDEVDVYGCIMSNHYVWSSTGNMSIWQQTDRTHNAYVTDSTGTDYNFTYDPGKAIGEWYDLVVTYTKSATPLAVYIDGVAVTPTSTSGSHNGTLRAAPYEWAIGGKPSVSSSFHYARELEVESFAFFGDDLTEAQIYDLSVPEPATLALLAMGGLALLRRKK